MKAIILAAGRGSRMGDATSKLPKCRTVFRDKELIQWQLEALRGAGIQEIAVVRGYLANTFKFDLTYFDNANWANTNMVMSLVSASAWLESDDCIVSYSDIVYSSDAICRLVDFHHNIAITYDPNWAQLWKQRFANPLSDAETFRLNGDLVEEIGNRATDIDEIEGQFMGLLKFTPQGWGITSEFIYSQNIIKQCRMDMTMLLQNLINNAVDVHAVPIQDAWFEIDSQADIVAASA